MFAKKAAVFFVVGSAAFYALAYAGDLGSLLVAAAAGFFAAELVR